LQRKAGTPSHIPFNVFVTYFSHPVGTMRAGDAFFIRSMAMTFETAIKPVPEAQGEKTTIDNFSQYHSWTANPTAPKEASTANTANLYLPLLAFADTNTQTGEGAGQSKTIDSGRTSSAAKPSDSHPPAVNPTETGEIPIKGSYGPSTDGGTESGQLKAARTIVQSVEHGQTNESAPIKPTVAEPIKPVST
jgi:hypothetical protein